MSANELTRRTELAVFALVAFSKFREQKPEYPCVHTVISGFNEAFRQFFPDENPVECMQVLAKEGLIEMRPAKKGAVYKPAINLLHEPTDEERSIALRASKFLAGFIAASSVKPQKQAKRTPTQEEAERLWNEGKTAEALKLLGYKL